MTTTDTRVRIKALLMELPQDAATERAALDLMERYHTRVLTIPDLYGPQSPAATAAHVEVLRLELLEDLQDLATGVRRCAVCGCTDADCRQCIAATGRPCFWVSGDPDLCSRCAEEGGAA